MHDPKCMFVANFFKIGLVVMMIEPATEHFLKTTFMGSRDPWFVWNGYFKQKLEIVFCRITILSPISLIYTFKF